jgi:hypothetical protein
MSGKSGEDAPQLPITRPLPTSAPRCW